MWCKFGHVTPQNWGLSCAERRTMERIESTPRSTLGNLGVGFWVLGVGVEGLGFGD